MIEKADKRGMELFESVPSSDEHTKLCPRCGSRKPWSEFASRSKNRPQPSSYCRTCQRAYCKQHYRDLRGLHNRRRYVRHAEERRLIAKRIYEYKQANSCVDCGEGDPVVLEFDHVRGQKRADIGGMVRTSTWHLIAEEIAKCDLRCANCHRRKTARQLGWKIHASAAET